MVEVNVWVWSLEGQFSSLTVCKASQQKANSHIILNNKPNYHHFHISDPVLTESPVKNPGKLMKRRWCHGEQFSQGK